VTGMKRHALGMVAGARRNYAALLFPFRESQNLIQCAAFFEGSGSLQIFELQVDRLAAGLGDAGRKASRRKVNRAGDA
jgi:hypothetical protein